MSAGAKLEGWNDVTRSLDYYMRTLSDENALADMMLDAAKPTVEAARSIVGTGSPWVQSRLTEKDISAWRDKGTAVGKVAVSVGSRKRFWILRFLEFGTSENAAFPVLRPAWDQTQAAVRAAVLSGLKSVFGGIH